MIKKGLNGLWDTHYLDFVRSPVVDVVNAVTQLFQGHAYEIEYGQTLHLRGCSTYLFYQLVNSEWTTIEGLGYKNFYIGEHLEELISSINSQAITFTINNTSDVIIYKWFDSKDTLSEFFYLCNSFDSSDKMYYDFVDNFNTPDRFRLL